MSAKKKPKRSKRSKSGAASEPAASSPLSGALAEAAWAEADSALAHALADFDEAETAKTKRARADALEMLGQSLARAARKRGLSRVGELGAREAFDPTQHDLVGSGVKKPKRVRIAARGVARGAEVIVQPRVRSKPRKKKT
jgi:hypothetical protein